MYLYTHLLILRTQTRDAPALKPAKQDIVIQVGASRSA